MEALEDGEVREYCVGGPDQRTSFWARARSSGDFPALVLPVFEVCRSIHFGTREGKRLDLGAFRDCWERLLAIHEEESVDGARLRVLEGGALDDENLPRAVWELAPVKPSTGPPKGTRRSDTRDPGPFREAFRSIDRAALRSLEDEPIQRRRWHATLPSLPAGSLARV